MLKTYTADYAFRVNQTPTAVLFEVERSTGKRGLSCDDGVNIDTQTETSQLRLPLTSLARFARLAELPETAEPLRVWAKTMEIGARREFLGSSIGALVGLMSALPLWPVVLASGVLGGVLGGALQYAPLHRTDRIDEMLISFASLARQAEGASPGALMCLQMKVQHVLSSFDDLGYSAVFLAEALSGLLEDALARQAD